MKKKFFLTVVIFLFAVLPTFALEFNEVGARASGMGGAFTAVAADAIGMYYNPAGIARQSGFDLQLPFGFNVLTTRDILKEAEEIYKRGNDLSISSKSGGSLTAAEYAKAIDFLSQVNDINKPGAGVLISGNGALGVRFKNWGISVISGVNLSARPEVDMVNIAFGTGSSNINNNAKVLTQLQGFAVAAVANDTNQVGKRSLTTEEQALATNIKNRIAASGIGLTVTADSLANELVYQAAQYKTLTLTDKDGKTYTIDQSALNFALPTLVQTAINIEAGSGTNANSIDSNLTNVVLNGIWLTEVALNYGKSDVLNIKGLDAGIALKVMKGTVGFYKQYLKQKEFESNDIKDDFDKNKKETTTFGVDLGFMYNIGAAGNTKIGLVLKNLNSPKFDQPDTAIANGYGKEIKLDPQARLGVSFHPWKRVFASFDLDLTENKTVLRDYKSRIFAAGLELNLLKQEQKNFNIALRGGYKSNLAESDEGAIITAGLGVSLLHIQLDFSGQMSTKTVKNEDGDKMPQSASAFATVSINF